jgi:hypothetical protein
MVAVTRLRPGWPDSGKCPTFRAFAQENADGTSRKFI